MDEFRARDLAWDLAEFGAVQHSPMALPRGTEFVRYLYLLIETTTPLQCVRRMVAATLLGRQFDELEMIRRQRKVLEIGAPEDAELGQVVKAMIAERAWCETCWLGDPHGEKTKSAFYAMTDPEERARFANLMRLGAAYESNDGFQVSWHARFRTLIVLAPVAAFVVLIAPLIEIVGRAGVDNSFIVLYALFSVAFCAWVAHFVWTAREGEITAVKAADASRGPKRVE